MDKLCIICGREHPFAGRSVILPEDLHNQNFILREKGSGTRAKVESILRENHISYNPQWKCTSFGAIKEAVRHNLGITIISPRVARHELLNGDLWACFIEGSSFKRTFDLVYRQNKYFSRSLKRFVELSTTVQNIGQNF